MAEFTLEAIKQESERQYGSTTVTTEDGSITFRAMLRLPDSDLGKVQGYINDVNQLVEAGDESLEAIQKMDSYMREALRVACAESDAQFETFAERLDRGDMLTLFQYWSNGTQPGEASA